MSDIRRHARLFNLDGRVELYDLDLTDVGGPVYRLAPMTAVVGIGSDAVFVSSVTGTGAADFLYSTKGIVPTVGYRIFFRMVYRRTTGTDDNMRLSLHDNAIVRGAHIAFDPSDPASAVYNVTAVNQGVACAPSGFTCPLGSDHGVVILAVTGEAWMTDGRLRVQCQSGTVQQTLQMCEITVWEEDQGGEVTQLGTLRPSLDFTLIGSATMTPSSPLGDHSPLRWRGNDYTPYPIEVAGYEMSSDGQMPRPKITLANVSGFVTTMLKTYGDVAGAKVTRWVTFRRFLDDGISPNADGHLPLEVYYVDQKTKETQVQVEWELASVLDQQGVMLPGRQVLRSGCQLLYRTYNGAVFSTPDSGSCPYTGSTYFKSDNTSTADPALDKCSQLLPGCLARFPTGAVPFGGFPSVGRIIR